MPKGRTTLYAIWRACERFKIKPFTWDDYNVIQQSELIAYSQIREVEENQ